MMTKNKILIVVSLLCFWLRWLSFAATTFCQPWNGRDNELNSCSPCSAWNFSAYGVSCNLCGPWSFAWPVASSCTVCPSWQSSKPGSISIHDCEPCPIGQVVIHGECSIPETTTNSNDQRSDSWWSVPSSWWWSNTSPSIPNNSWWPVYNQIPIGGWWMWLNGIRKIVIQKITKVVKKKKLIIRK